ncbi:beta-1,3-galactosyltransferase 5-like isoform X1 [Leguminivora glycinivorella]|uniref:beta-1,3-galactosyltransferase 5-like isoform X1 n=1 Tax=Leguminivora glycinivorella TaxID=1035111 RepID=UPI00200C7F82|nr:beta-1,3-galactosyltransferase 5-like isoform X1 [Leguminivora glycinivorella]
MATLPVFYVSWQLSQVVGGAFIPPPPPDLALHHFRANRSLVHYLDNINLLIEPSSVCQQRVPILILVTSMSSHHRHRDVIRDTWGKHQETYFFLGLSQDNDRLADAYIEEKQHRDLIVHDLRDHYQNLTLKVALMLQWALHRCPQAEFVFKTDDDVLVNPNTLKEVLRDNGDAKLFGYRNENVRPHRGRYNKWYLPRWLYNEDLIPEYLSGSGYIINGKNLKEIFNTALRVPLINIEDIYFTYLISKRALGFPLTHDRRLCPYKPWIFTCPYKNYASMHSLSPEEMESIWPRIQNLGNFCNYFTSELLLYYNPRPVG